jgi:hypothetical protein
MSIATRGGKQWSLAGAEAMPVLRSRETGYDNERRDDRRSRARQALDRLNAHKPKYRLTACLRRVASLDAKRSRSALAVKELCGQGSGDLILYGEVPLARQQQTNKYSAEGNYWLSRNSRDEPHVVVA